jgi:hypothetical protein
MVAATRCIVKPAGRRLPFESPLAWYKVRSRKRISRWLSQIDVSVDGELP